MKCVTTTSWANSLALGEYVSKDEKYHLAVVLDDEKMVCYTMRPWTALKTAALMLYMSLSALLFKK